MKTAKRLFILYGIFLSLLTIPEALSDSETWWFWLGNVGLLAGLYVVLSKVNHRFAKTERLFLQLTQVLHILYALSVLVSLPIFLLLGVMSVGLSESPLMILYAWVMLLFVIPLTLVIYNWSLLKKLKQTQQTEESNQETE